MKAPYDKTCQKIQLTNKYSKWWLIGYSVHKWTHEWIKKNFKGALISEIVIFGTENQDGEQKRKFSILEC